MHFADFSITTCLAGISIRLSDAAAVAKAALTCVTAGSEREALRIALGLDALLNEAQTLHGAVCLTGRMSLRTISKPPDI